VKKLGNTVDDAVAKRAVLRYQDLSAGIAAGRGLTVGSSRPDLGRGAGTQALCTEAAAVLGCRHPLGGFGHPGWPSSLVSLECMLEVTMDVKKLLGAAFLAFVILFVAGYLVHGVWLGDTYRQMRESGFSFRPVEVLHQKLWVILVSDFLYSLLFALVYAKGMEKKPWLGQGIRFGILATLFTVVPAALNEYAVYRLGYKLVIDWMVAGLVTLTLMALAVAAVLKKSIAA